MLAVLLTLATLAGCGGGGENNEALDDSAPLAPEEANSVTIRVSGTEGTAYVGDYGTLNVEDDLLTVEGTLGDEPEELEVEGDISQGVIAFFQKTQPGGEKLKVEIRAEDQTIIESTSYAELGETSLNWLPPERAFDEVLPGEENLPEDETSP